MFPEAKTLEYFGLWDKEAKIYVFLELPATTGRPSAFLLKQKRAWWQSAAMFFGKRTSRKLIRMPQI